MGEVDLAGLFDEIISKTERREAFSSVKESTIGFSPVEDMKALRDEFLAAETELELYYALVKLSNARRDRHLWVRGHDQGLQLPERRPCDSAPLRVLPEITDVHNPTFFVFEVGEDVNSPQVGDVIVRVNGSPIVDYIDEFTPWIRHSSLPELYWRMAMDLPRRIGDLPLSLYSENFHLTLERQSGEHYDVVLPYSSTCGGFIRAWSPPDPYPGFVGIMERENFNAFVDESRKLVLLQWLRFEMDDLALVHDITALMEYAENEDLLEYDMIIDVTYGRGGSGGAFAIQRLVDKPFRTTFGNVRLSDLGQVVVEHFADGRGRTNEEDIPGLNLSGTWLYEWASTDAREAIERGDEYTAPVPFKLAHLPRDSDGILQPAPIHFSGQIALINAMSRGGSHLDQFAAMLVDNDLATFIGVPTAGYSNTWELGETLRFPGTDRRVVRFYWTVGHTLRPNGQVLEGNPAQPDILLPLTRENWQGYHKLLLDTAIDALEP